MITRLRYASFAAAVFTASFATGKGDPLAKDSPFLAPGAASRLETSSNGRSPELRGIMSGPTGVQYCIYDPQKKTDVWIGLGDTGYPFAVTSADAGSDTVVLTTGDGRQITLKLRESKVASQGPVIAEAASNPASSPEAYAGLDPERAEQQRRNDEMRAAMARKRMERLQALKASAPPETPPQS
jgi:hypothetical protein